MDKDFDPNDKRWGGYIPWFLRHKDFTGSGDFLLFFERLSNRVYQLLLYNELGISNLMHFGALLESKSLQRYRDVFKPELRTASVSFSVRDYFAPNTITNEMKLFFYNDPVEKELREFLKKIDRIPGGHIDPHKNAMKQYEKMKLEAQKTKDEREAFYYRPLFIERLGVLEVILMNLPKESPWFADFVQDIRTYFAESGVMLDVNKTNYQIELLEETLFQREVLDNLLPRLKSRFPDRADELVTAYHNMLSGKEFDEIFIGAFKTLEEIGRSLTGDEKFDLSSPKDLSIYFPNVHPTIHKTIIMLAAHRGDKGGHGRSAPKAHEMRYLLFSVCNIALLMLDYSSEL
jgi:hypothetical protein